MSLVISPVITEVGHALACPPAKRRAAVPRDHDCRAKRGLSAPPNRRLESTRGLAFGMPESEAPGTGGAFEYISIRPADSPLCVELSEACRNLPRDVVAAPACLDRSECRAGSADRLHLRLDIHQCSDAFALKLDPTRLDVPAMSSAILAPQPPRRLNCYDIQREGTEACQVKRVMEMRTWLPHIWL